MLPQVRDRFDALIASGKLPLPLLPAVAAQVLAMVERPDCDARKLAELFKRDPAMTAHVMQVAGSPMYASATKITSLQQAIGRLGCQAAYVALEHPREVGDEMLREQQHVGRAHAQRR